MLLLGFVDVAVVVVVKLPRLAYFVGILSFVDIDIYLNDDDTHTHTYTYKLARIQFAYKCLDCYALKYNCGIV